MNDILQKQEKLAEECLQEGKELYINNHIAEAIKLLLKSKMVADSENKSEICAECANTLGVIYGAIGSLNISIDYYLEALRYAEECKYGRILELARNNIGSKYMDFGQYGKAVKIFRVCEKVLEEYGYLDKEKEIPMVTITYLNLIDSYCALANFDKAQEYIQKILPYIKKDPNQVFTFAFDITICRMKWKMGEKSYVREHLADIQESAYAHRTSSNYEQNMSNLCELLCWMEEYDAWENLLIHIEKYINCLDSIYLQKFVTKLWINYYRETNQIDGYTKKCVELTEIRQKASESELFERISIIDSKLDIYNIVSEHKESEKKFLQDTLTGVGNRLKLEQYFISITKELKIKHANLGIAMIDIDYFKAVNDTYGHLTGDEYLVKVADVLKCALADRGNVYRIGGDEFVLLIPGTQTTILEEIAGTLKEQLHALAIPNANSKAIPEVTLSQGYICKPVDGVMNKTAVLEEVDGVLYKVKKAGRNQYRVE